MLEYLSDNPSIIVHGFKAAQIPQSIDTGVHVLRSEETSKEDMHEETSAEEESNEENNAEDICDVAGNNGPVGGIGCPFDKQP